ncbi:MAG TPA: response regulator transcription factor [Phycisphaerae bacterium]|nr:response regulator transcription factor [Phycisphaerae bacterium]
MRVLIADDDQTYQTLLGDLMEQWGYEVECCGDGESAWNILQMASAPRLVLLDWMMPKMDGFDLCRKIRAWDKLAETYIILMTGSYKKDEIIRVLVAGADDYLIKPFEPVDLQIRLRNAQRILDLRDELAAMKRIPLSAK